MQRRFRSQCSSQNKCKNDELTLWFKDFRMPWSLFVWFSPWLFLISFPLVFTPLHAHTCIHMHHLPPFFSRICLSLMHVSTGERQEWMETLQTATRPPACGSQKRSGTLPHASSTNKRGLLELRGYKGRVLVSLAGSKVRLCKTEQVLLTPSGLPLYRMTASCFLFFCFLKGEDESLSEAVVADVEMLECVMCTKKIYLLEIASGYTEMHWALWKNCL